MPAATIEQALFQRLKADAVLNATLGGRIAPFKLRQGSAYPNLSYRRISTRRPKTMQGVLGLEGVRFKLDFWSTVGEEEITTIRQALVRQSGPIPGQQFLDGARGSWDGIMVQACLVEDVGDSPDLPMHWDDVGLYGASLDLSIWFELP